MPRLLSQIVSGNISWLFQLFFGKCIVHRKEGGKEKDQTKQKGGPNYEQPQPTMEPNIMLATICGARGLYMKNKTSLEAFVTVTLQGKGSLRSRAATEAIHTEGECRWDEVCEFKLSDKLTSVAVAVHSKTKLGSGELIGKCELDLDQAKQLGGGVNWLRLKKKNSDEKYRGEVQIKFEFSYEKPSMSISSTSLNHLGNEAKESSGGLMSKMKQKIKAAKGHKKAEDTMSMASAWSATSVKSTRSQRFFGKLGKTLGIKDKSATLPVGTFLTPNDNHLDSSNGLYETCASGGNAGLAESRNNSSFNVFDNVSNGNNTSRPASSVGALPANNIVHNSNPFEMNSPQPPVRTMTTPTARYQGIGGAPHAMTSPNIDVFQRNGSIRSMASSGFGSSKHQQRTIDPGNSQDLLAVIDSLKLELQVKDSRMKDMQSYMDNLITRVMERNPDLLAAPAKEKPRIRFF